MLEYLLPLLDVTLFNVALFNVTQFDITLLIGEISSGKIFVT